MYEVYSDEIFVLKTEEKKEKSLEVLAFSKFFGIIKIEVVDGRSEKSKLKNAFLKYSFSEVEIIKGKYSWRAVGGKMIKNFYFENKNQEKIIFLEKFFFYLEKFMILEKSEEELFSFCKNFFFFYFKDKDQDFSKKLEIFFMAYFLTFFGYFSLKGFDFVKKDFSQKKDFYFLEKISNEKFEKIEKEIKIFLEGFTF